MRRDALKKCSSTTDKHETTIPSFYFNTRKDNANLARQRWTQKWWDVLALKQTLVTSYAVIQELEHSGYPADKRAKCLALLQPLPLLAETPEIQPIVRYYIAHRLMPRDPSGDALHLAIASYYGCEFLVTGIVFTSPIRLRHGIFTA